MVFVTEQTAKERPVACVVMLIEDGKGRILLAKSPKWADKWVIPGGKIDYGETIEEALVRETKEETGLEIEPVHMLYVKDCIQPKNYYKKAHFLLLDYVCRIKGGKEKLDGNELTEFAWVKAEEALKKFDVDEWSAEAVNAYLKQRKP